MTTKGITEDRKKKIITLQVKIEIISKYEQGERVADLVRQYNRTSSTICTILKRKEYFKKLYAGLLKATPTQKDKEIEKVNEETFETRAEEFVADFKRLVESEHYVPQQVFNCDETSLFWKKLPKRTYITAEENLVVGHKPMKDRLSLLLCANASGDCKIKPLLVYHTENPRAFKNCKVQKKRLNVMWRSNSKAAVTRILFVEWVNDIFGPEVKKFLLERSLPLQALLVMDSASAHPPDLEDYLLDEFKFIQIKFLPPSTSPLLHPMDHEVILNFKMLYTKAMFQRCFEAMEGTNLSLRAFWKDQFHIVKCLKIIDKAWEGVTTRTLNSAWKRLWPECIPEKDFEGLDPMQEAFDEIVSLGKTMGLEVDKADIIELLQEHSEEPTTEDLLELLKAQQQEVAEDILPEEGEVDKPLAANDIRGMLRLWEILQNFVETHHPDKALSGRAANLFSDNAMSHFHNILNKRKQQSSQDKCYDRTDRKSVKEDGQLTRKRKLSDSLNGEIPSIEGAPDIFPEGLIGGGSSSKQYSNCTIFRARLPHASYESPQSQGDLKGGIVLERKSSCPEGRGRNAQKKTDQPNPSEDEQKIHIKEEQEDEWYLLKTEIDVKDEPVDPLEENILDIKEEILMKEESGEFQ
ncbi:tigger transposable element-derived protein 1-like isoform X2 [Palaemon carinicauda]|uniref:tigger transposable element-derived protein 1-like isoform X2 n=1 Tax=Palaemon carinicauda TaxID=392227 RepID=UPI0035B5FED4